MSNVIEKLRKIGNKNFGQSPRGVLSDLYSGRDQNEVARILGVTQKTISITLQRLRIPARAKRTPAPKGVVAQELTRRGRTTNQSARQLFLKLYRTQGKSLEAIASQLGAAPESVRSFALARGLKLRRQGRPSGKTRSRRSFDIYGCL